MSLDAQYTRAVEGSAQTFPNLFYNSGLKDGAENFRIRLYTSDMYAEIKGANGRGEVQQFDADQLRKVVRVPFKNLTEAFQVKLLSLSEKKQISCLELNEMTVLYATQMKADTDKTFWARFAQVATVATIGVVSIVGLAFIFGPMVAGSTLALLGLVVGLSLLSVLTVYLATKFDNSIFFSADQKIAYQRAKIMKKVYRLLEIANEAISPVRAIMQDGERKGILLQGPRKQADSGDRSA